MMESPLQMPGEIPKVQRQFQEVSAKRITESIVPIPGLLLDGNVQTIITAQGGEFIRIDHLAVHCVTGTPTVRIFLVPSGGSANQNTNAIIDTNFVADQTKHLESVEGCVLAPGMSFAVFSTTADQAILFTSLTRITQGK